MDIADRLAAFGVTIFTEMTALANEHRAINLGQGFPNWDGAGFVKAAAAEATLARGLDQYPPSPGVPELRAAIAHRYGPLLGRGLDPDVEITVTSGCTEALAATALGLFNPGDAAHLNLTVSFEPTAKPFCKVDEPVLAAARQRKARAAPRKLHGDAAADSAARAGEQHTLSGNPHNATSLERVVPRRSASSARKTFP